MSTCEEIRPEFEISLKWKSGHVAVLKLIYALQHSRVVVVDVHYQ